MRNGQKKEFARVLFAFMAMGALAAGMTAPPAFSNESRLRLGVETREYVFLEVHTSAQCLTNSGPTGTEVTTVLAADDNPVHVRVVLYVPRNQLVHLRVQPHGDMTNGRGETVPVSQVGWNATGPGFRSGSLSKDAPRIMAAWTGPGMYEGTVFYRYREAPAFPEDYRQTVTYSLILP